MKAGHRWPLGLVLGLMLTGVAGATVPGDTVPGNRDAVQSLLAEAGGALAEGDWDRATHLFEQAKDRAPESPLPWLGLSQSAAGRGQSDLALQHARRAQALAPDHPEPLRQIARLLVRLGAPTEALSSLEQLRRLSPKDEEAYVLAALILRQIQRIDEAHELLSSALPRHIQSPTVYEQKALLELSRGTAQEALDTAQKGLELYPEHGPLWVASGLASAATPEGRESAVKHLEKALTLPLPQRSKVLFELGSLKIELAQDGCSPEGIEQLSQALERSTSSAQIHFRLGNAYRACGDLEAAKTHLQRFQELNRTTEAEDHGGRAAGTELNRAQQEAAAGRLSSALDILEKLSAQTPDDDRPWILKAKVLFSIDRVDEAVEAARKARDLRPGRVEAHYLEGLFLSQSGRLEPARQSLERAAALDAERADVQGLLAAVLAELGEHGSAADRFELALALEPENANFRLAYARLLAAMGKEEESLRQMEVYRALASR